VSDTRRDPAVVPEVVDVVLGGGALTV
jgi:hypothetical protein